MSNLFQRMVHCLASSPYLNLSAGMVLLVCGGLESLAAITEELLWIPLGAHHGIAFFGAIQMLKALPDTMKAIRFVDDGDRALSSRSHDYGNGRTGSTDCEELAQCAHA